jgi:hypothetical protein
LIAIGRFVAAALILASSTVGSQAQASGYRFTRIDGPAPNADGTHLAGINNRGVITGLVFDASYNEQGFLGIPGHAFTTFGVPNGSVAFVPHQANLSGINDNGQIVGYVPGLASFLFEIDQGRLITFPVPTRLVHATARALNDANAIVGSFPNGSKTSGYILDIHNNLTVIDATVQTNWTAATGINNAGTVVGQYLVTTSRGLATAGFLRTSAGRITLLPTPTRIGGLTLAPEGIHYNAINDLGDTVGSFVDVNSNHHGFVRDAAGNFTVIDFPLALETSGLIGINNSGVLAGNFIGFDGSDHGFLATPTPTPTPTHASATPATPGSR